MSQSRSEKYQATVNELKQIVEAAQFVNDQLKDGVELDKAYLIIDRYWEGVEAADMKTQLSGTFLHENSSVILNHDFAPNFSSSGGFITAKAYLEEALPEIIELVECVYADINSKDLNDPEAMATYVNFRKEPARFIDYVNNDWWPNQEKILKDEIVTWYGIHEDSKSVERGSFLFLDDYRSLLTTAQQNLSKRVDETLRRDGFSLSSLVYRVEDLLVVIKMIELFARYLDFLLSKETQEDND